MPKGVHNGHRRGSDHCRWSTGRLESSHGYVKIRVGPEHPLADPNGYAYEHLVVWVSAGNPAPSSTEVLHHRNGDKVDNRLGNLELVGRSAHNRLHPQERDPATGRFVVNEELEDGLYTDG